MLSSYPTLLGMISGNKCCYVIIFSVVKKKKKNSSLDLQAVKKYVSCVEYGVCCVSF